MTITVTNQSQWDKLPPSFDEYTVVEIRSKEPISVIRIPGSSRVVAFGSSPLSV